MRNVQALKKVLSFYFGILWTLHWANIYLYMGSCLALSVLQAKQSEGKERNGRRIDRI